ncbi:putative histone acetyltransferase [Trypanosoma cruzi]|uniref:Histone acetyltransferase n=3 Tax=Trypanosoma cruzi TaxID=5693 RepID=Q4DUW6_TRYCC|nr:histone acetyltransferase, putative [Trypanosoma cruzi]EAN96319.1 histone acetyltransferase, putative [Trypanosoma cruzi]KAF8279211.1 putative histone acetyltransferase [Trypanosoma cruzi]PWU91200.1 putative histone acetyltransferase [Trypanosoma cruzi]|eukprot:XP_818170.1 histone acetyltransferase [Trypanosoma cruzi strain CL Brener]
MTRGMSVFEARQKVYATLHGTFHAAIVQEVAVDAETGQYLYYVHYVEQDSRMDCWLPASELKERRQGRQASKQQTNKPGGGGITTRGQSRLVAGKEDEVSRGPNTPTSSAKRSNLQNCVNISTTRARKDSSFFSRPKNIHAICMGPYEVATWYFSPYHLARPQIQQGLKQNAELFSGKMELQLRQENKKSAFQTAVVPTSFVLHICPFCLHPFTAHEDVVRHLQIVCPRHPPGNEIYRDPVRQLVVLEMDAVVEPVFCEHLALLSKLFLEHKALDHDMTPFLFYVLCAVQPHGLEVLGYFSKEKQSPEMYNLSCILVLPQFQSRGIGRFLIELSYELSRREGRIGSPEKPLSDLGEKLYLGYWGDVIVSALARAIEENHCATLDYLVQATYLSQADVLRTLQYLRLLNGTQIVVSEESIERCYSRRLHRERSGKNYVFYPHLLSWSPHMYYELKEQDVAPPIYVTQSEELEQNAASKGQRVL